MSKAYYVYIMINKLNSVLYTGMTGPGEVRPYEHANRMNQRSFTARYRANKVVYAEAFATPTEAKEAERRIKGWTRKKKITLIGSVNPSWEDLSEKDPSLRAEIQVL